MKTLLLIIALSGTAALWAQVTEIQHNPQACSLSHSLRGTVRCNGRGDGKSCVADGRYAHICKDGKMEWEDGQCSAFCQKELCMCCLPSKGR